MTTVLRPAALQDYSDLFALQIACVRGLGNANTYSDEEFDTYADYSQREGQPAMRSITIASLSTLTE